MYKIYYHKGGSHDDIKKDIGFFAIHWNRLC